MILLIHSLVHSILIIWPMDLYQYVLPNYFPRIMDYLVVYDGSTRSGATDKVFWGPSCVFVVRKDFGVPFIWIIPFVAPLSLCAANISLWVIVFFPGLLVLLYWLKFPWGLPDRINRYIDNKIYASPGKKWVIFSRISVVMKFAYLHPWYSVN